MFNRRIILPIICLVALMAAGSTQPHTSLERPRINKESNKISKFQNVFWKIGGSEFMDLRQSVESKQSVENRVVEIDLPVSLWVGGADTIRITLRPSQLDNVDVTSQNLPDNNGDVEIMLESRLDIAGLDIDPSMPVRSALQGTGDRVFQWKVSARSPGRYRGNLWLFINLYPHSGDEAEQIPLLIYPVEVTAINFLGLRLQTARSVGWVGMIASFLLLVIIYHRSYY